MNTPSHIHAVADLADGRAVRVTGPSGVFEILADGGERPVVAPESVLAHEAITQRLDDIDKRIVAVAGLVASTVESIGKLAAASRESIAEIAHAVDKDQDLLHAVQALRDVMERPVVPVYKDGKLVSASRADNAKT